MLALFRWLTLCALLGALSAPVHAEVAVPPLQARVTDLTGTLAAGDKATLEETLRGIESAHGAQIAVLLVPTTAPESIEQYSIRVAEQWKLGRKGVDDGLLVLVAKNDRKMRIEVGYGLEGAIPDAIAKRIVDDLMAPHFRQGDFIGGLQAAVQRLGELVAGEQPGGGAPPLVEPAAAPTDELPDFSLWWLAALVVVGTTVRWLLGPLIGGLTVGGLAGGIAWLISGAVEVALFAGIASFIFVLVGVANWISISLSGSGGGGSSGGGFSGGGGDFGGGGASGSW